MNLRKKKELAARVLEVGKERIVFLESRLEEIKEAITKQDIRDLLSHGAIIIKNVKGRRKVEKRKKRKSAGKIRKVIRKRKIAYMAMVRKQRGIVGEMKKQERLSNEEFKSLRNRIKNKHFKSASALREHIREMKK